jgi:hypothetical protein
MAKREWPRIWVIPPQEVWLPYMILGRAARYYRVAESSFCLGFDRQFYRLKNSCNLLVFFDLGTKYKDFSGIWPPVVVNLEARAMRRKLQGHVVR